TGERPLSSRPPCLRHRRCLVLFGQDLCHWKRADPDMTPSVSMSYNTRDVAGENRQSDDVAEAWESVHHETGYAENPHHTYWKPAQTSRFATDVSGSGPWRAD